MATQQRANPAQMNYAARAMLLQTGISMTKRIQAVTGAMGSNLQIPLQRMGIMTGVTLLFTCAPTWGGSDANAPNLVSLCAPFNLVKEVSYQDFAGVKRTKTSGYQLWAAQAMKNADMSGTITTKSNVNLPSALDTNILSVSKTAAQPTYFSLYIPMAYDPASDLTGAVLSQTNVGEHFINVQLPSASVGTDPWVFPYQNGAVDAGTDDVTVEAFQHYIQPQSMDPRMLPLVDLSTIYGFEGGYQNVANIVSGQSNYINYPNNRSILSTLVTYENNAVFTQDSTDIAALTLLVNSNTNFREMTPRLLREQMRNVLGGDLVNNTFYIASRRQPILTQLYANVQLKMDIITANAGITQTISQFEVQYPSGSPLPGITG